MSLKEFIKTKKINKDKFIALYNKDNRWIICGTPDEPRLAEYMDLNVISSDLTGLVLRIQIDYDQIMQKSYYDLKASEKISTVIRSDQNSKASRSDPKSRSRTKK